MPDGSRTALIELPKFLLYYMVILAREWQNFCGERWTLDSVLHISPVILVIFEPHHATTGLKVVLYSVWKSNLMYLIIKHLDLN